MEILSAAILGFVQGITEFLPISSSGHLVLIGTFLPLGSIDSAFFDVLLHMATLLAIVLYFRKDIKMLCTTLYRMLSGVRVENSQRILFWGLFLGTIPAVFVGLLIEPLTESIFRSLFVVAGALVAGSIIFFIAEKVATQDTELTARKAFLIGCMQVLAFVPGMSRSGSTISGGLLLGLTREQSARFSFLLALPIIFGAGIVKISDVDISAISLIEVQIVTVGMLTAFISGLYSIHFLLKFLKSHTLIPFAWYRIILAGAVVAFVVVSGV